uniref:Dolichol kinase n=1 Tax=Macrostomum lignano TaxID=282301 RepID=A0A1I8FMR3_9PLAT
VTRPRDHHDVHLFRTIRHVQRSVLPFKIKEHLHSIGSVLQSDLLHSHLLFLVCLCSTVFWISELAKLMHRHHYNFSRAALSLIGLIIVVEFAIAARCLQPRRLLTVLLSLPGRPPCNLVGRYFNVNKSAVSDARAAADECPRFCAAPFCAPYRLTGSARRLAWRAAGILGAGGFRHRRVWDLPAVETHQAKKSDPQQPVPAVHGGTARAVPLVPAWPVRSRPDGAEQLACLPLGESSAWPRCSRAAAAAAAAAAGSRISLLGAENFLRLFADKPGLGPTVRAFSRAAAQPAGIGSDLGASGVLSALLVAYNALTADQNVQLGQQQESGSSSPSSLALLGVIPLPWLTPAVGLSVWAGVEAVSWMVTASGGVACPG